MEDIKKGSTAQLQSMSKEEFHRYYDQWGNSLE